MSIDTIIFLVLIAIALYVAWSHGKLTGINKTLTGAQAPAVSAAVKAGASTVGTDLRNALNAVESALKSAAPAPAAPPPAAPAPLKPVTPAQLAALGYTVA